MKRLKAAVIGLGVGVKHIKEYRSHPQVDLVALCDIDESRLDRIAEKFSVSNTFTDSKQMLEEEELDLVSIATPNQLHAAKSIEALNAGCHVLCEKPMARNANEAAAMLSCAEKFRKMLVINFPYRYHETSLAIKKRIEAGDLGKIHYCRSVWHRRQGVPRSESWYTNRELSGGGALIDIGVHRLDLSLWLMGFPEPDWVLAGNPNAIGAAFEIENFFSGMIRFKNGATLFIESSWVSHIKQNELIEMHLLGDQGGISQTNANGGVEFEAVHHSQNSKGGEVLSIAQKEVPVSSVHHFIDSILQGEPYAVNSDKVLMVNRLIDAMYSSALSGEPVAYQY